MSGAGLTVAGSVFLASDKSVRVEKAPVRTSLDFIDHVGLEINVQRAGHVFARRRFGKERAEAAVASRGRPFQKATIGLNISSSASDTGIRGRARTLRPCSTV